MIKSSDKKKFASAMDSLNLHLGESTKNRAVTIYNKNEPNDAGFVPNMLKKFPSDEAPLINWPATAKEIFVIALAISIIIGSCYKVVMYKGICTTSNQNGG